MKIIETLLTVSTRTRFSIPDLPIRPIRVTVMRGPPRAGIGGRARRLRTQGEGPEEQDRRVRRTDRLTERGGPRSTGTAQEPAINTRTSNRLKNQQSPQRTTPHSSSLSNQLTQHSVYT